MYFSSGQYYYYTTRTTIVVVLGSFQMGTEIRSSGHIFLSGRVLTLIYTHCDSLTFGLFVERAPTDRRSSGAPTPRATKRFRNTIGYYKTKKKFAKIAKTALKQTQIVIERMLHATGAVSRREIFFFFFLSEHSLGREIRRNARRTCKTRLGKLRSSSSVICVRYVGLSNTGGLSLTSFTWITTIVWFSFRLSDADRCNSYCGDNGVRYIVSLSSFHRTV